MKTRFKCPLCRVTLRVKDNIIFKVRTDDHRMGIVLLNPELGNYSYWSPPELKFIDGEKIEFMCPVCCESLNADHLQKDLVEIIMIGSDKKEYRVCFSSVAGRHATFKIMGDNVVEEFGKDCAAYNDYFRKQINHN